jgi:hypothetical protein
LDEEVEGDVENAWDDELTQRMQSIDNGTAVGETASQVLSDLQEKYA